ncbi:MAG: ATP-binding protein [Pseudomonadota bacterium]
MILDLATRRADELLEVQVLYLLASIVALLVVEPWAILLGYMIVQLSEFYGLVVAKRIFEAAADPKCSLQNFANPVVIYEFTSAFAVSLALAIAFFYTVPSWQLGIIAIWCMALTYFVFPTVYCVRSLYGCIIINSSMMAAAIVTCFVMTDNLSSESLLADLGLCVFGAATAAFIGRQLRGDYVSGLDRERELTRTINELDRQNAEKMDFVGHLSHELRTPMNGLMGMAALLRQDLDRPEQREKLDVMLKSGATLVELLNNSLDLSKLEAGAVRMETGSCALQTLLEDQVQLYSATAEAKGLTITLDLSPDVPKLLLMDSLRIMQVVGNLVSNAVKFSNSGTIAVHAEYDRSISSPMVIITVKDQGVGIPAERIDTIFNAYSQAHSNVPREYPGAGLGLAISSRLAKLMGGTLKVGSKVGQGSTFYFSFVGIEAPSLET